MHCSLSILRACTGCVVCLRVSDHVSHRLGAVESCRPQHSRLLAVHFGIDRRSHRIACSALNPQCPLLRKQQHIECSVNVQARAVGLKNDRAHLRSGHSCTRSAHGLATTAVHVSSADVSLPSRTSHSAPQSSAAPRSERLSAAQTSLFGAIGAHASSVTGTTSSARIPSSSVPPRYSSFSPR
jgi:hypothetical protein